MGALTDIHSHILPGVDDGAEDLATTKAMLLAAKDAGVTAIIATPHLRKKAADFGCIRGAFHGVKPMFDENGVELRLGYECHYGMLLDGLDAKACTLGGTNVLLLEFSSGYLPLQWENDINDMQRSGLDVVIAHPERYEPIQRDISVAERMTEIGCELQVSAGSLTGSVFSKTRKCALKLLDKGLVGYIASDAHCAEDYRVYSRVMARYSRMIKPGTLLKSLAKEAQ